MKIRDLIDILLIRIPEKYTESYDNVGLLLGDGEDELKRVLINLDVTEAVIEEAINAGANLILTHHPFWFSNRKNLAVSTNSIDFTGRIAMKALKNGISLATVHTNLDRYPLGVNYKIAKKLNLSNLSILKPSHQFASEAINGIGPGFGMVGYLDNPVSKMDFLKLIKETFSCRGIRYSDSYHEMIQKVAVGGGSCKELYIDAIKCGADAYLTADVSYHYFFEPMKQLLFMDIGHYEIEQFTTELIFDILIELFPNFAPENRCIKSSINTNSVSYF